jgi:hypothetical protein
MPSICIITPTYIRDIGRFAVLRQSIQLFAPDLAHLAIIHTEDCGEFRERFGNQQNLKIVPTVDVLPPTVEQRRRKSGLRWLTGKWLHRRQIKGWHAQQLAKIFALANSPYEAAVFLDSDVFICRPLRPEYFYVDGQLKLFRRQAPNAECLDYDISAHDILGNQLHQITELYDYIYHPACFRRSTALCLLEEFRRRKRSTWVRRFVAQNRPSEYHLLGYAATVLEGGAGYHLVECRPEELHHSIRFWEDRARFHEEVERMWAQPKPFALVQSCLGVEVKQIAAAFERVAQCAQPVSLLSASPVVQPPGEIRKAGSESVVA